MPVLMSVDETTYSDQVNHGQEFVGIGALVDELEVRRFAAEPRAVVDDLAIDLPGHVVDKAHRGLPLSVVEEVVDVFIGDLGERRVCTRFLHFLEEGFEDPVELFAGLLHAQTHEPEARFGIEDHH